MWEHVVSGVRTLGENQGDSKPSRYIMQRQRIVFCYRLVYVSCFHWSARVLIHSQLASNTASAVGKQYSIGQQAYLTTGWCIIQSAKFSVLEFASRLSWNDVKGINNEESYIRGLKKRITSFAQGEFQNIIIIIFQNLGACVDTKIWTIL